MTDWEKYGEAIRHRPRYRCPKCKRDDGLWAEVEATAWIGLDEFLSPSGDHDVDRVDWRNATRTGEGGCGECQWEGSLAALEHLGWDGEPLPAIHPGQISIGVKP